MTKKTEIIVADQSVRVVEYRGQRVVTFTMIDAVHRRPEGTAGRNFRENRERFIEGEDYFKVCADEIRRRNPGAISNKATEDVTVFTEAGYLMLVKSFTDDLAWQVQRQLVNRYFRKEEPAPKVTAGNTALDKLRTANALKLAEETAAKLCARFSRLGESAQQVIYAKIINPIAGDDVLMLPRVEEKLKKAGEVGDLLGVSGNKIGRLSNQHGMKTAEYGEFRLDKSEHSSKQVETFHYNAKAVEKFRTILAEEVPEKVVPISGDLGHAG